jgi:hypothetical protein
VTFQTLQRVSQPDGIVRARGGGDAVGIPATWGDHVTDDEYAAAPLDT